MAMTITGTFPEGIIYQGAICRNFTLEELRFEHILQIAHDPATDVDRLSEDVYYDAAKYAKRLKVEGIDQVTPEMVLDLSGPNSTELIIQTATLEKRRQDFRDAAQAAAEEGAGAPQTGLPTE